MRSVTTVLAVVALALTFAVAASAADGGQPAPPPTATTPVAGQTPANPQAPVAKTPKPLAIGQGYLKTTPEVQALWTQLGQIESDLHQKEWELFVLFNAQPVDRRAVRTKYGEVRDLMRQMKDVRQKLEPSWVPLPRAQGRGKGKGVGGAAGQAQQAAPQQPATAPAP